MEPGDGWVHVLTALVGHQVLQEDRSLQATALHPQYAVYGEEVNHSFDEYFHLMNFQLVELLYLLAAIPQPAESVQ